MTAFRGTPAGPESGDLVVRLDSATTSASVTKDVSCAYQLNYKRGAIDGVGLLMKQVAANDIDGQPLGAISGPCFHTSLMRGIELTNEVIGSVGVRVVTDRSGATPSAHNAFASLSPDGVWSNPGRCVVSLPDPPTREVTIVSGRPAPGNWALIFTFIPAQRGRQDRHHPSHFHWRRWLAAPGSAT